MKREVRELILAGALLLLSQAARNPAHAGEVEDYLRSLANEMYAQRQLPATLAAWQASREDVRVKFMELIGLDPLPAKTPLNIQLVGITADLGDCTFQRVVFESRPKNYVAAHLYIPKNANYPVPAIIYVPGHNGRDAYTNHPHTYAANGCIALALQAAGEEGKLGTGEDVAGWANGGHMGPYFGHFEWYNTGYSSSAVEVWDGIRAVDYLLALTNGQGSLMVDANKIGMAGRSGGAIRTLLTSAADPRIAVAVASQGFNCIKDYDATCGVGCDAHLFYNYFGFEFSTLFGLIAPRALLVQHGTMDPYFPTPQPVADDLIALYGVYAQSSKFQFTIHNQGHNDSTALQTEEYTWLNRWLSGINANMNPKGSVTATVFTPCFPNGDPADKVHSEQQYTPATPVFNVSTLGDFNAFKNNLMGTMQSKIIRRAFLPIAANLQLVGTREEYGNYYVEEKSLVLRSVLTHKAYYFCAPGAARKTVLLLANGSLDKASMTALYTGKYFPEGINLCAIEITGIGGTPWPSGNGDRYTYDRFAALVGHTRASIRVNDILAAVQTLSTEPGVDPLGIYVWGKGTLAVPALYAAVANSSIAGVILEDAPDHHVGYTPVLETKNETTLFLILKYADMLQSAGLLFPRRIVLTGAKGTGFSWTKALYASLGKAGEFREDAGNMSLTQMLGRSGRRSDFDGDRKDDLLLRNPGDGKVQVWLMK